ncbi:MAG: YgiQ family radical SAM protein [Thermotogota bacterium]
MFDIPTNKNDMNKMNIKQLDVILVSGDSFVDHPSYGVAIIARVLKELAGLSVGVISQPNWKNTKDISKLGIPKYFWGVTSGNMDSMVSNYTASKKKRNTDVYSPEGSFRKRPDRATVVYTNLIKQFNKDKPVIIGGIEASLRRFAHYDWWQNKVKQSILLDSKADLLVYGMAEKTILDISKIFKNNGSINDCKKLRGIVYQLKKNEELNVDNYIEMPSYEETANNKNKYTEAFNIFYNNIDPYQSKSLIQKHQNRHVVQTLPQYPLSQKEMDDVYSLHYTKEVAPEELSKGYVKSIDTVRTSITTHRGCYGECSFCAIALHQGRYIQSRSKDSIVKEVKELTNKNDFKGYISDLGGPTANMYGDDCEKKIKVGACLDKSCIGTNHCKLLNHSHENYLDLLETVKNIKGIKKVFISSGIRYDLIQNDKKNGDEFLYKLLKFHNPGRFKIAPEHSDSQILKLMNKPSFKHTEAFIKKLNEIKKEKNLNTKFSSYLISAHPGADMKKDINLSKDIKKYFPFQPEDIQIFTPTPSTKSTTMYYTEKNPDTGDNIFVEKNEKKRKEHKNILFKNKRRF